MPDEEEACHQEIMRTLRELLKSVDEVTRLLRTLVDGRGSNVEFSERSASHSARCDGGMESLTGRERDVFKLLLTGMSNRQMGRRLDMAERTVKNNLHSIYRKLGVSGRAEAISKHLGTCNRNGSQAATQLGRETSDARPESP
ncbi:helix-turn-helix domain-containing protein [Streptomyces alfalfae]|uniref:Helix-turn-helix transcriptional regulator n=1 Tax=Streptomyces alfalfae TaxID=1642299 RepID=A0A7T4PLW3_9ACTN|nr:helix-turn-helix transcriptional regulator [Streptomyces alfalfae]QQC92666.1 helix-turn-helix transcriptional regulator [Streptomyces alfalfae]